jgi:COX assembly mitochondrial protein 2
MRQLEECHERGFLWKVFGNCNEAKRNVNRCLSAARVERVAQNRKIAKQDRQKVVQRWKEIEENS